MSDRERERIEPTVAGQARLLAAVDVRAPACTVDAAALGEYAAVLVERGQSAADATFPETADHVRLGCDTCTVDLPALVALLATPDEQSAAQDTDVRPDTGLPMSALNDRLRAAEGISLVTNRPAEHPPVPVTPPAAEPSRRRRDGLHLRDRLLIAAAVAIVVVGVVLLGLAYFSARQPAPSQPSSGRAVPTGATCPPGLPIKGNRESKIYHQPGGEFYEATRPEECFATPADAEAAGYRRSQR